MSVILLPIEAKESAIESGVAKGAQTAGWTAKQNSLSALVKDLSQFKDNVDVTSIPDIWAGPKAFEAQLVAGIEEQRVMWRALLAAVGLRKVLRLNMSVKTISIPAVGSEAYKSRHPFLQVVSRLLDKEFAACAGGDRINLLCCNNRVFAMVWPNSIIYPVSGLNMDLPWWDSVNGRYQDPAAKAPAADDSADAGSLRYLSKEQSEILALWLVKLQTAVGNGSTATSEAISAELEKYVNDLGYDVKDLANDEQAITQDLIYTPKDDSFYIEGYCSMLSQAYSTPANITDIDSSNIRLDSLTKSEDGVKPAKRVLVVDEGIARQWGRQASNIKCFGATDLGSAVEIVKNETKKKQFIDECQLSNFAAEIWTSADFFTPKIVFVTSSSAFPNSLTEAELYKSAFCFTYGKNQTQEFILPIRKEVLDYIKPEDLVKSIQIERDGANGSVKVSLTINLSGCDSKAGYQSVVLTKIYEGNDIVKSGSIPNVQIWPNFKADCWKQYYVFTSASSVGKMLIEPAWTSAGAENVNFDIAAEETRVKIRRGSEFPAVFTCQITDNGYRHDVGVLCLDTAKLEKVHNNVNNKTPIIGVDFGTTNSVVYYATDYAKGSNNQVLPEQLMFADRNFAVTRVDESISKADLRRYFFSSGQQPEAIGAINSIRTIFHDFNVDVNKINNLEQPMVLGNIYYLENGENISDDKVVIDELNGNIKWDNKENDAKNVQRMHSFIYQICLQAMAEAVVSGARAVTWQYSWPTAYDSNKRHNYADFWSTQLISAMNEIADISDAKRVYQKTESMSMADYFQDGIASQSQANAYSNGMITIDIGGGSTDIAIWKGLDANNGLNRLHQCSFRLAGTDILANYIQGKYKKNPSLLTPLGSNILNLKEKFNRLQELAAMAKEAPAKWKTFELELESILKYSEKEIINGMGVTAFAGAQYQELNIVMRDIAFALGGMFYYVGSIIAYLRNHKPCPIEDKLPDCFVGGNGSKLLNWAAKGSFAGNRSLNELLRDCLVWGMIDSLGIPGTEEMTNFKVEQSDKPKHEVAAGLICSKGEDSNNLDDSLSANTPAAGGKFGKFAQIGGGSSLIAANNAPTAKIKQTMEPVVAGEAYYKNGVLVDSIAEMLTAENFTDNEKYIDLNKDIDSNMFVRYCNVFNHEMEVNNLYNGKHIAFASANDLSRIFEKVANDLLYRRTRKNQSVVVEPIFIMELREALKMLSSY